MAATKYSVTTNNHLAAIDDIEAALNAKGLITSTLYKSGGYLIFSTPLLTNKVIKIQYSSGLEDFFVWYGDSWSSGSTIVNQVPFATHNVGTSEIVNAIDVIADSNFFSLMVRTSTIKQLFCYVGALTNGDELLFGVSSYNDSHGAGGCLSKNMTYNKNLFPVGFSGAGLKDPSGNIFTMPLMWGDSNNIAEMDGGAPAGTVGVKISTVRNLLNGAWGGGVGYILTPCYMYYGIGTALLSSLLIEYTP